MRQRPGERIEDRNPPRTRDRSLPCSYGSGGSAVTNDTASTARLLRPTLRSALRNTFRNALDLIVPFDCLGCGRRPAQPLGLCLVCRGQLRRVIPGCEQCGRRLPAFERPGRGHSALGRAFVCGGCRAHPPPFDRLLAAWVFEQPLRAAIHALKFGRLGPLARPLVDAAWDVLADRLLPSAESTPPDLIVPVPLAWTRHYRRGFNQARLIAEGWSRHLERPVVSLLRRRRGRPQSRLPLRERAISAHRSYRATSRGKLLLPGASVLLVDDVVTTAATFGAAARVLRRCGAVEITAVALAQTPLPNGPHPAPQGRSALLTVHQETKRHKKAASRFDRSGQDSGRLPAALC